MRDSATLIDSLQFAHTGAVLTGEVAAASLPRLRDLLASDRGVLKYRLHGLLADSKPRIDCIIEGTVEVTCQRCLENLSFAVNVSNRLLLVTSEADLPNMAEEDEDLDALVADPNMDAMAWIEDEIILALPIAPRHDFECVHKQQDQTAAEHRPFAALAQLKHR
jgi:uncharacterized protein